MTDATVPVPVDLLKDLGRAYHSFTAGDAYAPVATMPTYVKALVNLIPLPPKVGDVVTAENVKDLPAGTVLRDSTDDIWLVGPLGSLSYINPSRTGPRAYPLIDPAWDVYEPVIISLPRD